MLADSIWFYIGNRVDNDNVLPDEDEIYTKFRRYFEILGYNPDEIAETVQSYVSASDLTGVDIEWEGELSWKPYSASSKIEITTENNSKKIS